MFTPAPALVISVNATGNPDLRYADGTIERNKSGYITLPTPFHLENWPKDWAPPLEEDDGTILSIKIGAEPHVFKCTLDATDGSGPVFKEYPEDRLKQVNPNVLEWLHKRPKKTLFFNPVDKEIPELDVLTFIGDGDFIGRTHGDKPQYFVITEEDLDGVDTAVIEHCKVSLMKEVLIMPCYLTCEGEGRFTESDSHGTNFPPCDVGYLRQLGFWDNNAIEDSKLHIGEKRKFVGARKRVSSFRRGRINVRSVSDTYTSYFYSPPNEFCALTSAKNACLLAGIDIPSQLRNCTLDGQASLPEIIGRVCRQFSKVTQSQDGTSQLLAILQNQNEGIFAVQFGRHCVAWDATKKFCVCTTYSLLPDYIEETLERLGMTPKNIQSYGIKAYKIKEN